jgi:dolichol kinase
MKKHLIICSLTIITFVLLTVFTAKNEIAFDGNNFYGFPLTFHTEYSKMFHSNSQNETDMIKNNYLFLVLDIIFSFLLSVVFYKVYEKFRKKIINNL